MGIENLIPDELKPVAVPYVRPRLRNYVHDRAGIRPVTGIEAVGLYAEFLQRVGKWERIVGVAHQVFVVGAVQVVTDLVRARAVDRNGLRYRTGPHGNLLGVSLLDAMSVGTRGSRHEKRQVRGVASNQRNALYAALLDHLAQNRRNSIYEHRRRFHNDLLG